MKLRRQEYTQLHNGQSTCVCKESRMTAIRDGRVNRITLFANGFTHHLLLWWGTVEVRGWDPRTVRVWMREEEELMLTALDTNTTGQLLKSEGEKNRSLNFTILYEGVLRVPDKACNRSLTLNSMHPTTSLRPYSLLLPVHGSLLVTSLLVVSLKPLASSKVSF